MKKVLTFISGIVAAILALTLFALAIFTASTTKHSLRATEHEHLSAAVKFIHDRQSATGSVPENIEFENWTKAMDAKGFRFDGNGFTLDKHCGKRADEFCIYFSTGDGFATYQSWQASTEQVTLDDSPLPIAFGLLIASLLVAVISKALFTSKGQPSS